MKSKQSIAGRDLTAEQRALWVGLKDCRLAGRKFDIRKENSLDSIVFICPIENLIVQIGRNSAVIEIQTISDPVSGATEDKMKIPIDRIRVDIGLVLAKIRGHFNKKAATC